MDNQKETSKEVSTQAIQNATVKVNGNKKIHKNMDISSSSGKFIIKRHDIPHAKFLNLYHMPQMWKRYLIVILIGVISSFELIFFVKSPGNYSSGIGALTQGFSRLIYTVILQAGNEENYKMAWVVYNVMFWGLYVVINIPLFILGWKKIGKTFTKLTILYIVTSSIVGFVISSTIYNIQDVLLLGNTIPMGTQWANWDVSMSDNYFAWAGVNAVPFWYPTDNIQIFDTARDGYKAISLFLYAFVHGVFLSIMCSILYIVGASTGGTDFLSFYFTNKGKQLGRMLLIISMVTTFIGTSMGSWMAAGIVNSAGWNYQFLFSANLIASFLSAFICIMFLRVFYPTQKIVKLEIFSHKTQAIIDHLVKIQYVHSGTLYKAEGMRRKQPIDTIVTFCEFSEVIRITEEVETVDANAFITTLPVAGIHGWFYEYRQGDAIVTAEAARVVEKPIIEDSSVK